MGRRHNLYSHLGGIPLSRRGARCLQSQDCGLGDGDPLRTELVLKAFAMALAQRRPAEVIHHSDQGSQYTSLAFVKRCQQAGVRPSMGTVGDCFDNAMGERFFATLECELLERTSDL